MPNWNENYMIIRGSKEQREEFKKKYCSLVKNQWFDREILTLDFDKVIPQPKTREECPEEYIIHNETDAKKNHLSFDKKDPKNWFNWYKWRIDNWSTKWEANPIDSGETKTSLWIMFDTAWAPPENIIEKLIIDNYDLKITCRYNEPGMQLNGRYSYLDYDSKSIEKFKRFV